MKKIISSFIIVMIFMIGCTDLHDDMYDRIHEDDYTADPAMLMSPIYEPMQDLLDWGGWWFAQELTGDGVTCPVRGEHWYDGGKWIDLHKHDWDNETEAIGAMWGTYFEGAGEANEFIEQQKPLAGDPVIDEAIAKAKILRSYYYYLLIDNYGDVPYITSHVDAPENPETDPREEIFEDLVATVEESVAMLDPQVSTTSVTPAMAYTLLAKLYLNAEVYTGDSDEQYWQKAEAYCDSVLDLGYNLEPDPLAPFSNTNQDSPENIWVIPYHKDNYHGNNLHMRTLHYQHDKTFNMAVEPWNGFAVMEEHFHSYEDNDRRADGFIYGQQYSHTGDSLFHSSGESVYLDPEIPQLNMGPGTEEATVIEFAGARVNKFEIPMGATDNLSNHFPVFRLADIKLMKAEALIRQNGPGAGDDYVNIIRQRAGLDSWNNVDLDMLLEERGREMFWEGHRRQDLIRFGKFNEEWWEKPESSPDRKVFPIPQWAVEANPNLEN